jgi:ribosomal protein S18 acetylase RimI-like enzyme
MDDKLSIVSVDSPDWETIGKGIGDYNRLHAGDDSSQYVCFLLRSPSEETVGGVIGEINYGWLHVFLLWVAEDFRRRGFGRRLLAKAEEEGVRRGAANAYLDTFSFQAPDFYKALGYEVFGELTDFPKGHDRYYMRKAL